jgi:hypothetical protein
VEIRGPIASFPRRRKPLEKTEQERQEFEAVPVELANGTSQQAHDYIQDRLEAATTVAEMAAILVELLPVLKAGLVVLGRGTLNE